MSQGEEQNEVTVYGRQIIFIWLAVVWAVTHVFICAGEQTASREAQGCTREYQSCLS